MALLTQKQREGKDLIYLAEWYKCRKTKKSQLYRGKSNPACSSLQKVQERKGTEWTPCKWEQKDLVAFLFLFFSFSSEKV